MNYQKVEPFWVNAPRYAEIVSAKNTMYHFTKGQTMPVIYGSFPSQLELRQGRWVTESQARMLDDYDGAAEAFRLREPKPLRQIVGEGFAMLAIIGLFLLSLYAFTGGAQ